MQGWVVIAPDAGQQASECEQQFPSTDPHKPLLGIPIGVKDLVDIAGLPTRCGSRQTTSALVKFDATAIWRLRDAGAVILGKSTTHEYAFGGTTPPTRNSWDPERIPGGRQADQEQFSAPVNNDLVRSIISPRSRTTTRLVGCDVN